LVHGVPIACKKYGLEHNNNAIERHKEDFKQRYKVTRGYKNPKSGEAFGELRRLTYNFIRTHQGICKTPAEDAELNLPLGRNKLLNLINFFLLSRHTSIFVRLLSCPCGIARGFTEFQHECKMVN
jgi:hypothetical protein